MRRRTPVVDPGDKELTSEERKLVDRYVRKELRKFAQPRYVTPPDTLAREETVVVRELHARAYAENLVRYRRTDPDHPMVVFVFGGA